MWYKIKFRPKKTLKGTTLSGSKKVFKKGKVYTILRKLTQTIYKNREKIAQEFGYTILSIEKVRK